MRKHPNHKQPPHRPAPHAPQKAPPQKQPTHWGEVADWYDKLVGEEGSEYHREVILPGVMRLLQIDKGTSPQVADLACGQGVLCRKLAEAGCRVTGIDAAAPLIEAAQRRNETDRLGIRYEVADVTKLLSDDNKLAATLKPGFFDAVTIILAIQNMTPLSPVWKAVHAILKPGGQLIVVMMHPCFRVPRQSDWMWENTGSGGVGAQGRLIYEYLSSSKVDIQTHPGLAAHGKDDASTPHFHRPLQAYINTMTNAGLLIDHLDEWISHKVSQPGPKKAALDKARKEFPLFLALRARKIS